MVTQEQKLQRRNFGLDDHVSLAGVLTISSILSLYINQAKLQSSYRIRICRVPSELLLDIRDSRLWAETIHGTSVTTPRPISLNQKERRLKNHPFGWSQSLSLCGLDECLLEGGMLTNPIRIEVTKKNMSRRSWILCDRCAYLSLLLYQVSPCEHQHFECFWICLPNNTTSRALCNKRLLGESRAPRIVYKHPRCLGVLARLWISTHHWVEFLGVKPALAAGATVTAPILRLQGARTAKPTETSALVTSRDASCY